MRTLFYILTIILLSTSACKKTDFTFNTLEGRWKMISIKDNATGTMATKPSSNPGSVDISFGFTTSSKGILTGVTPTNSFSADFTIEPNQKITIRNLAATKVAETPWGQLFLTNITNATEYSFESNAQMVIKAGNNSLVFSKL